MRAILKFGQPQVRSIQDGEQEGMEVGGSLAAAGVVMPINQKYPWRMSPKWVQGEQDKACTMVFLSMTLADFPLGIFLWNAAKVMSFLACKSCALPPFFVFGRIKVLFHYKLSEWTKKCFELYRLCFCDSHFWHPSLLPLSLCWMGTYQLTPCL